MIKKKAKKKSSPSNQKTIPMIRPNAGIRTWYQKELDKLVKEINDSVVYWMEAEYNKSGIANDASPVVMLKDAMRNLAARWTKKFNDKSVELATRFADKTMVNTESSLKTAFKDIGVTVDFKMTEEMRNGLNAVIAENVNLIKSIPEKYLREVEFLVMQSASRGRDLSVLSDELVKRYGITKRRAAFIALDQNQKATTAMVQARQQSLGITKGIWKHSHAGKEPRPSHLKADGEEFDLSKGLYLDGAWVLPGQLPRCRCGWTVKLDFLN